VGKSVSFSIVLYPQDIAKSYDYSEESNNHMIVLYLVGVYVEFEAVMVLPEITIITITVIMLVMHLVSKVITLKT